jgi:phage tail-like protein
MSPNHNAVATPPVGVPVIAPGATGTGVLTVSVDGNVVQVLSLTARPLRIGRLPDNGLVLPHPSISRHHAEIRLEGAHAILTDLGSSAGSMVGDHRLRANEPVALESGDTARIGPYTLTYAVIAGSPAAPMQWPPATMAPVGAAAPVDEAVLVRPPGRSTFPVPLPAGPVSRYVAHLPGVYQENEFLSRLLLIFEAVWEPLEQRQDHFPLYFSPRTCPAGFVPWLASWLHLSLDAHWPEARQRALLAEAMELYRWRGTPYGLVRMIEVCTGLTPLIVEGRDQPYVFTITVTIPSGSVVRRELVEELVATHKPAHVGYILDVR